MTSDIEATCERLEEACQTIERGNPMMAVDSIRGVIKWMGDMDTITWIPVEFNGVCMITGSLPDDDEPKLVSTRTSTGRIGWNRAYWNGERWVGNIGTAEVYAWADIAPYQEQEAAGGCRRMTNIY